MIGPDFSMLMSPGRCILKTNVLVLYFPNRVPVIHLPNPCRSSPLAMIADDMFPNAMMVVPPGL